MFNNLLMKYKGRLLFEAAAVDTDGGPFASALYMLADILQ